MVRDNKINLKLEVCRDKTSGKLSIMARFNENAPNIFKEKGCYLWMPTPEEKDFLNEAFALIPLNTPHITSNITPPKPRRNIAAKAISGFGPEIPDDEPDDIPTIEKADESSVFEAVSNDKKTIEIEKDIKIQREEIPIIRNKPIVVEESKEPEFDESEPEKKYDRGIIVEADSEAIDAALKKYTSKDKSFVEADEQTIIDKVLSQKKKGKWSKR